MIRSSDDRHQRLEFLPSRQVPKARATAALPRMIPTTIIFFTYAHAREGKASKSASFARVAISLIRLTH
jgi:hypothetical protein